MENTKEKTFRQVISEIRKEFSCSYEEARRINHARNKERVKQFCTRVKEKVRSDEEAQKIWENAFGKRL